MIVVVDYILSRASMSDLVFSNTLLKQAGQNRLEVEKAFLGLGISKHFSFLATSLPQPRHSDFLPAVFNAGHPAEPLTSDGILFFDILK